MGINCISCINGRTIKSEIPVGIFNNSYFLKKIIKIQSNFRGFLQRKIKKNIKNHYLTPNKMNFKITNKISYIIVNKVNITKEQLDFLFQNYKIIN